MARFFAAVCCLVLVCGSHALAESESRLWSDASGKFKIEAKLLEVKNGKAVLLKADGKKVEIPVTKLSDADQKHIAESENPFDAPAGTPAPAPAPVGTAPTKAKAGPAWSPPNFKTLRQVPGLGKNDKKPWALEPVPTPANLVARVELPTFDFHDRPSGVLSVNGEWYALSLQNPFKNHRLCLVNLKTGELVATGEAEKDSKHIVAAVSPDGKFVLTHHEVWANKEAGNASIWTVEGSVLKKQFDWKPFATGNDYWQNSKSAVTWGAFADPQRMLLMADGYIVNWDPTTGRPSYQANLKPNLLKLLPDGKHLLAVTNDAIGVMDVVAGRLLFYKGMAVHGASSIDISPDGTKLLVHQGSAVKILDFATGEPIKDILVEGSGQETVWAGNNHVLVGGKDLLDLEREFVCWTYSGQKTTFTAGGKVWFLAAGSEDRPAALVSANLPHAEALQRIREAEQDPSFFALRPGTKVNLLVDVPGGPVDLRQTLQKKLESSGYVYDSLAEITLTAKGYPGETREITVSDFGAFRGEGRKYQFQTNITTLQMVRDGAVLWSRYSASYPPSIFNTQAGESEAAALKRYEAPNMGIFEHSVMPKFIVNPGRAGNTVITAAGL